MALWRSSSHTIAMLQSDSYWRYPLTVWSSLQGINPQISHGKVQVLLPRQQPLFSCPGNMVANWTGHLFRAKLWFNYNHSHRPKGFPPVTSLSQTNLWLLPMNVQRQDVSQIVCPSAGHNGNEIGTKCHRHLAWTAQCRRWKENLKLRKSRKSFSTIRGSYYGSSSAI